MAEPRKSDSSERIIVDLGKKSRKQVRRLRKGKGGKLTTEVDDIVSRLGADAAGKAVVIVVRQKSRRKGFGRSWPRSWLPC